MHLQERWIDMDVYVEIGLVNHPADELTQATEAMLGS